MTSIVDPIHAQTVGELETRDDYLVQLEREALDHAALHHPWLQAMSTSRLPDMRWAARDFAKTYVGYSAWFTHYLRGVIGNLTDPRHRALLTENLEEEKGELHDEDRQALIDIGIDIDSVDGVPHPELFRRFCRAVDLTDDELREVPPIAQRWRVRFRKFLEQSSAAAGVGALGLGTESIVAPLYERLLPGLERLPGLTRPDWVFFELHCKVDDQHQKDLLEVARDLASTPAGKRDLRRGMMFALELRLEIWNYLYERATRRGEVA